MLSSLGFPYETERAEKLPELGWGWGVSGWVGTCPPPVVFALNISAQTV